MEQISLEFIIKESDLIWRKIRWRDGIRCSCGCSEYYQLSDGRYKCKECGKIFSDTTGTLLHHSKLEKWKWLWCIYKMSSSKGISNIELAKDLSVNVKTAWLLQQKVRYCMKQDYFNLEGIIRMDEAYIGGWSDMHFGRKMKFMREHNFLSDDNRYTKSEICAAVSYKKFHIVSMVDNNGLTKIIHTPNPITKDIIRQIVNKHCTNTELLITDESKLYNGLNIPVEQSNHSKHVYMTSGGHTSNPCENRFSWVKRKWNGIYTHTSEKYLQLYLNQMTWSVNHKDLSKTDKFYSLLYTCTCAGEITNQTIFNYNYLDGFEVNDVYEKERKLAKDIIKNSCGLIAMVQTPHKIKFSK